MKKLSLRKIVLSGDVRMRTAFTLSQVYTIKLLPGR
jgi:hypothetical protein